MIEFSEKAQAKARDILRGDPAEIRTVLLSLAPYHEANDLMGANLVLMSWRVTGVMPAVLMNYARDNKKDEEIRPILEWLRDTFLSPARDPKLDMLAMDRAAEAWIRANRPVD